MTDRGVCTLDTIAVHGGFYLNPFKPEKHLISPITLAHSLGMLCRFGGHCNRFYSVAEHSLNVYALTRDPWGLFHDGAEGLGLMDIPRPVKRQPPMDAYRALENDLLKVIGERFNLPWPIPDAVHWADNLMLRAEAEELFDEMPEWARTYPEPTPEQRKLISIDGLSPGAAKFEFLTCLKTLQKVHGFSWSST